jgi:hypothetical protein
MRVKAAGRVVLEAGITAALAAETRPAKAATENFILTEV